MEKIERDRTDLLQQESSLIFSIGVRRSLERNRREERMTRFGLIRDNKVIDHYEDIPDTLSDIMPGIVTVV
jgi:hypothetical protein